MFIRELLLLLMIINSTVALICYECDGPGDHGDQVFPFRITEDNIPTLANCTEINEEESDKDCVLMIQWDYNTTSILVGIEDFPISHGLDDYMIQFMRVESVETVQVIGYQCRTDYCNNPSKLKLLIQSTKFEVDRQSIISLITANQSSSPTPELCATYSNYTNPIKIFDRSCSVSNRSGNCTQCQTLMVMNTSTTEMCSGCSSFWSSYYSFENIVIYEIHNLTWFTQNYFDVKCVDIQDCNSFENIQRIQKFYTMKFDVSRFFGITTTTDPSEITTTVSDGTVLFPIIYLISFTFILLFQRFLN